MKNSKLAVVVPCYNESESLPIFYPAIRDILEKTGKENQLLFVNDGSKDETQNLLYELASTDQHVSYISFSRNFGKEAALLAGLQHAKGDYICVMDADLQDPPEMLFDMISILDEDQADVAAARRMDREGEPKIRSFFSDLFYKVINRISDTEIVNGARDFRLMKKEVVDVIVSMPERNRFSKGLFSWVGFRTKWLPYSHTDRAAGSTKWSFWKLFKYALDGIENFSNAPLYISSGFGILMTLISIISLIFLIVRKLIFGDPVAGWASSICIIIFIGGIQLFCLGIVGQYLAKVYTETKNRPPYVIASKKLPEKDEKVNEKNDSADMTQKEKKEI